MPTELLDTLYNGLRAFYIIGLPIVLVLTAASVIVTILQTALGMQEHTVSFAARLVALLVLLYAFMPTAADTLISLAQLSFK